MITKRNKYTFGLGTIGRDMVYSMISMYLIYYLTDVLELPTTSIWWITGIILCCRVFDALNDPIMGVVVDNTHSRFGKFKPWIVLGALTTGIVAILLFMDMGLTGGAYIVVFAILYLFFGITFTINDISYWSMLPSLSLDQKEREKIGAVARICANIGLFFVVVGIVPITKTLGAYFGSLQKGYFAFGIIVVVIMWIGQAITIFGVKEAVASADDRQEHTTLKNMLTVIFKNDQLLYTAISMALFMIGYMTTTSFGLYYFKYVYGDEGMYSVFALVLGISQLAALLMFPLVSKKYERGQMYLFATILVVVGYIIFFFAPTDTMIFIGMAGVLIFIGEAAIQLLMLMFLADTVEYGHWKFGKRNDSVTFSLQPFINKMGGAVASGIVGATVIISGIKEARNATEVTANGLLILKIAMLVLPLAFILIGYCIYKTKYIIDKETYQKIIRELSERGAIEDKTRG